jgi:uncharacterized small protein (DUF1192 family)
MSLPSWQDRFRKERTAKNVLVYQVKDLNTAFTQLQKKIISTSTSTSSSSHGYTRDESNFISELKSRNQAFLCENKRLTGKLKCAFFTVQRLKEQEQSLKRRLKGSTPHNGSTMGCVSSDRIKVSSDTDQMLQSALEQNQILQEEINRLKALPLNRIENKVDGSAYSLSEENLSAQEAARVLKIEYDTLESTSRVQLQVHKKTRAKLEQCNDHIRKLQGEAYALESINNITRKESVSLDQYQEHVEELVEGNRRLEDKLANLCDLPFIQEEPVKDRYHLEELQDLENELDRCKHEMDVHSKANFCLEDNLDTLEKENTALLLASDDLRQQISCLDDEFARYRNSVSRKINSCHAWSQTAVSDGYSVPEFPCSDDVDTSSMSSRRKRVILLSKMDVIQYASIRQITQTTSLLFEEHLAPLDEKKDPLDVQITDQISSDWDGDDPVDMMLIGSFSECHLNSPSIDKDTRSVLVMTFLNFEPLASNVATGPHPNYQLFISSKLKKQWFKPGYIEFVKIRFEVFTVSENVIESLSHATVSTADLQSLERKQTQVLLNLCSQNQESGFLKVNLGISTFGRLPEDDSCYST